jgi:hypothetical protein
MTVNEQVMITNYTSTHAHTHSKRDLSLTLKQQLEHLHHAILPQTVPARYNNYNNSIQFFIIYVPSQQLQGQLQTQHSVDISNYIMGEHNLK